MKLQLISKQIYSIRLELAAVDVVSCHVSNQVNAHQCTQRSSRLHYNPNSASAHSVVDPVKGTGR